jgi:hypothetical protein
MSPTGAPPPPRSNLATYKTNATSNTSRENQAVKSPIDEKWANREYQNSLKVTFAEQLPEIGRADIVYDIVVSEILKSQEDARFIEFFAPVRGTSWVLRSLEKFGYIFISAGINTNLLAILYIILKSVHFCTFV